MNDMVSAILLLSVPGLPLLFTLPALRARLPWFRYFVVLPAAITALLPVNYSMEFPWLLFASQLSIDGISRLLLAVSVLIWLAAAMLYSKTVLSTENQPVSGSIKRSREVFFLLAMAGNFGAILAADVVSFFVFSTLLGYAFYGLLVASTKQQMSAETLRAGKIYLVVMIIADLLLFEVLLIGALVTDNLSFSALHQNMLHSQSLTLYTGLVLFAFALKAGIWPLHFWLIVVLRRIPPSMAFLLSAVPVSMALLGILRWLPLGEISMPVMALVVQTIAVIAVLYAASSGLWGLWKKHSNKQLAIHAVLLISGVFMVLIGMGLADAAAWSRYENGLYILLAILGLVLAASLAIAARSLSHNNYSLTTATQADIGIDDTAVWFERWTVSAGLWAAKFSRDTLPGWRDSWLSKARYLWLAVCRWKKVIRLYEYSLRNWRVATTLFLSLAVIVFSIVMFNTA